MPEIAGREASLSEPVGNGFQPSWAICEILKDMNERARSLMWERAGRGWLGQRVLLGEQEGAGEKPGWRCGGLGHLGQVWMHPEGPRAPWKVRKWKRGVGG